MPIEQMVKQVSSERGKLTHYSYLEQAQLSPKDRAWQIRGIEDLRLILANIKPDFQNQTMIDQLGQDLTMLSDFRLVKLPDDSGLLGGIRKFYGNSYLTDFDGKAKFGSHTETIWETSGFGLEDSEGVQMYIAVYNELGSDGFPGPLIQYYIRAGLANSKIPSLEQFISRDRRGTNFGLKPGMLEVAVRAVFDQLPTDLAWRLIGYNGQSVRGMEGYGKSANGDLISAKVYTDGWAELTVAPKPADTFEN